MEPKAITLRGYMDFMNFFRSQKRELLKEKESAS